MNATSFKNYQRGQRALVIEQNCSKGMFYSDAPLAETYCKALVNYDYKDNGMVLVPRGGYRALDKIDLDSSDYAKMTHHIAQAAITLDGMEDENSRYILLCDDRSNMDSFDYANMQMLIETGVDNGIPQMESAQMLKTGEGSYQILGRHILENKEMHGMHILNDRVKPLYALLNNHPYFPISYDDGTDPVTGLGTLNFAQIEDGSYTATIKGINPQVITPSEAVNYGYNMLSKTPYTFADEINAAVGTGYLFLNGILAYNSVACVTPLFNARVGQWVTFRVYASFPDNTAQYKFKWEIRDLGSDAVLVYEDQEHTYHFDDAEGHGYAVDENGSPYIKLEIQPPYKQCGITVTAYLASAPDEPIQVMALGSYSLSSDTAGTNRGFEVKNYNLDATQGMAVWAQRLVLWGVPGAKNMIFISDVNNVSYFPYPNNCDIFDEDVIHCTPYMSDLLVWTTSKLWRLTWAQDGLSFSKTVIQDRLMLSMYDADTICVVKNMVFFKNGSYFYMLVPNVNKEGGELNLAPISQPITALLDNFEREITDLFMTIYNPTRFFTVPGDQVMKLQLMDTSSYLDNTVVRNVYKLLLTSVTAEDNTIMTGMSLSFSLILNYDMLLRTWYCHIVQSNMELMPIYRQTVTDNTIYLNIINSRSESNTVSSALEFVKITPQEPKDTLTLEMFDKYLPNWQYQDTGFRDIDFEHKKRFREIQFKINDIGQLSMEFGMEFDIDEQLRRELFKYTLQHDTDPESQTYGRVYYEREYANPVVFPGAAVLEEEDESLWAKPYPSNPLLTSGDVLYSNRWVLSFSKLSGVSMSVIRLPVSGKGHAPRMKLLSFNESLYEYRGHSWVFRTMNAR